ncbi:heat shock 70 kDa protein 12A-like [Saccostrea echinata]|uniref:heat shock 70 kDa protein 12A-like n=1 Tax=Saccostrea echinata TaxID=191078 RepID=UPI002A81684E|nr:heat shock 70 kDa protein 12A-like [Saccostrea echinata]
MSDEDEGPLVVVAIDFGTTYSGYAFSLLNQFQNDPTKIYAFTNWIPASGGLISSKTPSSLLLKPNKEFYKFGYEAEDTYADLAVDDEHHEYYFFRRFKMLLHRNPHLSRDTKIADASGKELPAKVVFGHGISYLKSHALNIMKQQGFEIEDSEIRWVLTVPAIWSEPAKQFMREAAQKADITNDQLIIALEPEAASVFCRHIPDATGADVFDSGSKYMVIDLGGGTADITVHQVDNDGTLRELHRATGGAWGGTKVDAAYEQFLIDIVEEEVWAEFRSKHGGDYLDIFREFELKKRTVTCKEDMPQRVVIKVPISLRELYEKMKSRSFKEAVENHEMYYKRISSISDKIKIDSELVKGFFRDPLDKLIEHLQKVLLVQNVRGTKTFLLVGGFAESPIVQETLRQQFPHIKIITPGDAGLTVLKGAVIFGHKPLSIRSRISHSTFGIAISKPFIEGHHPPEKRIATANGIMCKDIFHKYVECDESVEHGCVHSVPFTMGRGSSVSRVRVYSSSETDPMFVTDEGCKPLGEMILNVGNIVEASNNVSVGFIFGKTELTVEASERTTGQTFRARFDFLNN